MLSQLLDRRHPWRRSVDYALLPTTTGSQAHSGKQGPKLRTRLSKRYTRTFLAIFVLLSVIGLLYCLERTQQEPVETGEVVEEDPPYPPMFEEYHERERTLPQHNLSLPPPEGRHAKFFWAANHVHGSGWGNAMQELVLNAHLAHAAKRSYVFDNYTWNRDGPDYSDYNGKLIPSRIPLSAMISGPIIGGNLPPGDDTPRAVSKEYFRKVCPDRTIINSGEMHDALGDVSAGTLLEQWVEKLNSIEDPCIEIEMNARQIFDIWVFGSTRVHDIWPTLSKSPALTQFQWSPLIHAAYMKNKALFEPKPWPLLSLLPSLPLFSTPPDPYAPLPGVLALHIRRGDFDNHCHHMANWSSTYNGFNTLPVLPDRFSIPPGGLWGDNTPENRAIYIKHCFPSVEQIVARAMEVRAGPGGHGLNRVYIMTNGAVPWVRELKDALERAAKWKAVVSSRDLKLSWEQKYVAQAVDMMIGQRAQMFVGNGFSSLTSNIVMLRMSKRFPPNSTRFW